MDLHKIDYTFQIPDLISVTNARCQSVNSLFVNKGSRESLDRVKLIADRLSGGK